MMHFSTRQFESGEREQAWREALATHCGPYEVKTREAFEARMERGHIGDLECVQMVQNAQFMRRSHKELGATRPDLYYVMLQVAGQSRISQARKEIDMMPGNVVVLASGEPLSMTYKGKNAHLCVHVPRYLLDPPGGSVAHVGEKISGSSAALIGSLMQTAIANVSALDQIHHEALRQSLLAVTRAALTSSLAWSPQDVALAAGSHGVMETIREYINRNLDSETLSPFSIAQALGMSVRHIHRLFQGSGTSVGALVLRLRLERCAADLRDAALRDVSVTAIAFRWGFNDSAHFSRTFKAEFGQAPRDYRLTALGERRVHPAAQREGVLSEAL